MDKVLTRIKEWLTGRRQKVVLVLNGYESEWVEVKKGTVYSVFLRIFINDFKVVTRGEEKSARQNQMTLFEVTKSVISLYVHVDKTMLNIVTFWIYTTFNKEALGQC